MAATLEVGVAVLVINCGSSSVKAAVVVPDDGAELATLLVQRVGRPGVRATLEVGGASRDIPLPDAAGHEAALSATLPSMLAALPAGQRVSVVGHRVVHGGEDFDAPTRIDDAVVDAIDSLAVLAPLHNPANLAGIRAARALLGQLPHVAVFDTAFHATMPAAARTYALPPALCQRLGIRRYGFHGTSHAYVARRAAAWLGQDWRSLRIITCHLGNGASIAAVDRGRSVDTSMGLTPLEGLVMGTRSGDVDPGVLLMIMRREGLDVDAMDLLLNRDSGLAALSGLGPDLRDIEAAAAEGNPRARLAIDVSCHRLKRYIGGYAAVMGGVDVVVFTGGIGEHSAQVRRLSTEGLGFMGVQLDSARNEAGVVDEERPVAELSADNSLVHVLAVRTDEQLEIARQAWEVAGGLAQAVPAPPPIPIAVSARHVHLTDEAVEILFGAGHRLTPYKPLSQPGQFAAEETLTIHGPKSSIEGVRVLGPTRKACQVEIARTDEFKLGIDAPVRRSGDVAGSAPIVLEGPAGRLELPEGAICAWRHIHMRPADAAAYGVRQGDLVEVAVDSDGRDLVFGDVLVRVSDRYALEMHVDTDEANAAELSRGQTGVLVTTTGRARVLRRQPRPGEAPPGG